MKAKVLLLTLLASIGIMVTGCGDELEEPLTRDYETLNGEFQSLGGIRVNKTITNLFEDDEGEIYYAYSDRYDLNDKEYFGQRVEVYGVVMTFESMDKEVFEVRRITEAEEQSDDDVDVNDVEYKDTDLGFSITYPDSWTLNALRDSIQIEAPLPVADEETTEESEEADTTDELEIPLEPDFMIIAKLDATLTTTSDDEQSIRAEEIRAYVEGTYEHLAALTSQLTYIGVDSQFAVRYKAENGDINYFLPRNDGLFEVGFYHAATSEDGKLDNVNTFSEIVTTFRFLPYGDEAVDEELVDEEDADEEDASDEEPEVKEPEVEEVEVEAEVSASSGLQVYFTDYLEFESTPFKFKVSYPSSWYYSGGSGGYDFNDEPIEDDTEPLLRLDLNVSTTEGTVTAGSTVKITILVGDRYYTLSGPSEYQDVIQAMIDSIIPVETE